MPLGPGKYDDICTTVRQETEAGAVMLIIFDGNRGNGFSAQVEGSPMHVLRIAETLEQVARQLRESMKGH